jgi:hypothetical protein
MCHGLGRTRELILLGLLSANRSTSWPGQNLVDCAIYPRMHKLFIRADFDGKGLNENTAESIVFSP